MHKAGSLITFLAAGLLGLPAGASAPPKSLLHAWDRAVKQCGRGPTGNPQTREACREMDTYSRRIYEAGWCYGPHGRTGPEFMWYKCNAAKRVPHIIKGTPYSKARKTLLAQGYKPVLLATKRDCDYESLCKRYPEMEACAGTGTGPCKFVWRKHGLIDVFTEWDPPIVSAVEPHHS